MCLATLKTMREKYTDRVCRRRKIPRRQVINGFCLEFTEGLLEDLQYMILEGHLWKNGRAILRNDKPVNSDLTQLARFTVLELAKQINFPISASPVQKEIDLLGDTAEKIVHRWKP